MACPGVGGLFLVFNLLSRSKYLVFMTMMPSFRFSFFFFFLAPTHWSGALILVDLERDLKSALTCISLGIALFSSPTYM